MNFSLCKYILSNHPMKFNIPYILAFLLLFFSAQSCVDDGLYDSEFIGEGEATISAEVFFDNPTPALSRSTSGGSSGTAINDMSSICVLFYTSHGKIAKDASDNPLKFYFNDIKTEKVDNEKPGDAPDTEQGEHWAQTGATSTVKAKMTLYNVPFGKYKVYAIANVSEDILTQDVISDIDNVKNLRFNWQEGNISANNQMFGFFSANNSSIGFDAPDLVVNNSEQDMHAWVRRLVSKVTVAFDARNLKDDVDIYLINATVKDIPSTCFLGKENKATDMEELITSGQTIMYVDNPEETPYDENWPARISNERPIYGFNTSAVGVGSIEEQIAAQHGENVNALYLYENIQGKGELGTVTDKRQVVTDVGNETMPTYPNGNTPPDGTEANAPENTGFKDGKIYGSYVEVQAYYISENPSEISRGYITYRFMLGKDIYTDYNVERNYHYKVTLCFNGYANDVDWHIAYDQQPKIIGPTPCSISYLYNQSMNYSFHVVGGDLIELKAQIPVNDITKASWSPKNGEVTAEDQAAAQQVGGTVYWTGKVNDPGPWNGFLSLRRTTEAEYGTVEEGYGSSIAETYNLNKIKFYGSTNYQPTNNNVYNLGYREYDVKEGTHEDAAGTYSVTNIAPNVWNVEIPLFTRPRVMSAQTGYSGNNPYVAYNRQSQVVLTAKVRTPDGKVTEVTKTIDVIQARRVVNPKAVWRDANSVKPFHVQLKIRESQTSNTFTNLLSNGPWRAEVAVGKDWIELAPTSDASQFNDDGSISGTGYQYDSENVIGRSIDFSFKPKSTTVEPRGGIIKVYYNNYSCVHTLFVRQGFDPVEFYGNGTMWHTTNMLTGGDATTPALEEKQPQEEGSYFRKFNRKYPIDALSNTASNPFWIQDGMKKQFIIAGASETRKWENITINPKPTDWGKFLVDVHGETVECRLPKKQDWQSIIGNPATVYGYGILYGDDAVETKEAIDEAYSATHGNYGKGYGMRGVIVCDENTGTQIFMPIAASGFGRFKQKNPAYYNALRLPQGWGGVVQYANRFSWFTQEWGYGVYYKPLFYDLYSSQGALYWLAEGYALDINYVTLGFVMQSESDVGLIWPTNADPSGSDAVHIRLVHDKAGN